jgi:pilus assembly protein Flp/PilA
MAERNRSFAKAPIARFIADGSGATAIEYSLIAGAIAVAVAAVVFVLGSSVNSLFTSVSTTI